jgi:hypothetical protein
MTVHIGDHVHPVGVPVMELTVDRIVDETASGIGHLMLYTHDVRGRKVLVSAEDTEPDNPAAARDWTPGVPVVEIGGAS